MIITTIFYVFVGLLSGLAAGLFGIGGGALIVPSLAFLLKLKGVDDSMVMHIAAGTSLVIMLPTAILSTRLHLKADTVLKELFFFLLPYAVVGAFLGAVLGRLISSDILSFIFGLFLCFLSVTVSTNRKARTKTREQWRLSLSMKTSIGYRLFGFLVGVSGGVMGIGGGVLLGPFLISRGYPAKDASGTSAAMTLPICIVGASISILAGLSFHHIAFPYTTGFVYWPAVVSMIPGALFGTYLGVGMAKKLHPAPLKILFSVFLAILSVKMMWIVIA